MDHQQPEQEVCMQPVQVEENNLSRAAQNFKTAKTYTPFRAERKNRPRK